MTCPKQCACRQQVLVGLAAGAATRSAGSSRIGVEPAFASNRKASKISKRPA